MYSGDELYGDEITSGLDPDQRSQPATFADPGVALLRARLAKARALAAVLAQYGFDVEDAKLMDDHDWDLAAKGAGVRRPSPATRRIVIEEMANQRQR